MTSVHNSQFGSQFKPLPLPVPSAGAVPRAALRDNDDARGRRRRRIGVLLDPLRPSHQPHDDAGALGNPGAPCQQPSQNRVLSVISVVCNGWLQMTLKMLFGPKHPPGLSRDPLRLHPTQVGGGAIQKNTNNTTYLRKIQTGRPAGRADFLAPPPSFHPFSFNPVTFLPLSSLSFLHCLSSPIPLVFTSPPRHPHAFACPQKGKKGSVVAALREVYAEGGLRGLFKGARPGLNGSDGSPPPRRG